MQGLTDGHIAVSGHEDENEDLQAAKEMEREDLYHALTEIVVFFERASTIILGATEVQKQVSDKDRWARKTHTGLLSSPGGLDSGNDQNVTQQHAQIKKQENDKHCFPPNRIPCQLEQKNLTLFSCMIMSEKGKSEKISL